MITCWVQRFKEKKAWQQNWIHLMLLWKIKYSPRKLRKIAKLVISANYLLTMEISTYILRGKPVRVTKHTLRVKTTSRALRCVLWLQRSPTPISTNQLIQPETDFYLRRTMDLTWCLARNLPLPEEPTIEALTANSASAQWGRQTHRTVCKWASSRVSSIACHLTVKISACKIQTMWRWSRDWRGRLHSDLPLAKLTCSLIAIRDGDLHYHGLSAHSSRSATTSWWHLHLAGRKFSWASWHWPSPSSASSSTSVPMS